MKDLRAALQNQTLRNLFLSLMLLAAPMAVAQDAPPPAQDSRAPVAADATDPDTASSAATDAGDEEELTSGQVLFRKLRQGGGVMWFLAALSVIGVGYAIERLVNLRRGRLVPQGLAAEADRLYKAGDIQQLEQRLARNKSTLARMISAVLEHREAGAAEVSVIAGDLGARDLKRHLQRAYPLAVIATLSPLLGLLGTVIGMIGAFDKVEAMGEMADAAAFGGDIAKALITTGAGLAVAIPALALYHFFKSRTNIFGIVLEEQVTELITRWLVKRQPQATAPASPAGQPAATSQGAAT